MNVTVSPSLRSLALQKSAQPFVNEQHVCFPNVVVVVNTGHGDRGPLSVYQRPSNPDAPCVRQYAVGTSCAHPKRLRLDIAQTKLSASPRTSRLINVTTTLKFNNE